MTRSRRQTADWRSQITLNGISHATFYCSSHPSVSPVSVTPPKLCIHEFDFTSPVPALWFVLEEKQANFPGSGKLTESISKSFSSNRLWC